jgi:acyl-CoA thioester hydrolase
MHERLQGYPIVIEIPVAWGEMDAFGHVNNIIYLRYFESARVAYFTRAGFFPRSGESTIGAILASIQCAYKFPLVYPDTVWAAVRVAEVGEDRLTMHHRIVSQRHGRVAAEGEGVVVSYDYAIRQKARVPDDLRQRIAEIEAGNAGTA